MCSVTCNLMGEQVGGGWETSAELGGWRGWDKKGRVKFNVTKEQCTLSFRIDYITVMTYACVVALWGKSSRKAIKHIYKNLWQVVQAALNWKKHIFETVFKIRERLNLVSFGLLLVFISRNECKSIMCITCMYNMGIPIDLVLGYFLWLQTCWCIW